MNLREAIRILETHARVPVDPAERQGLFAALSLLRRMAREQEVPADDV